VPKFQVVRVWDVEAKNATDAVAKTKNWKHHTTYSYKKGGEMEKHQKSALQKALDIILGDEL